MKTIRDIEGQTLFSLSDLTGMVGTGLLAEFNNTMLASLIDNLSFTQAAIRKINKGCLVRLSVVQDSEIVISPFGSVVEIVIGSNGHLTVFDLHLCIQEQNDYVRLKAELKEIPLLLRIDANILRPLIPGTNKPDLASRSLDISLGIANISYDSTMGVELDFTVNVILPRCMIGETGIMIEASHIQPVFGINDTLPSEEVASFRGVFIESAKIYLPEGLPQISIENCSIGSNGFSGKVSGNWTPQLADNKKSFTGNGAGDIFGIPFALKEVAIEFKQNTLVESKIEGAMILPFFDQVVNCEVRLTNDGDFTVALSSEQDIPANAPEEMPIPERGDDGLFKFTRAGLLELKLKSIQFKKEADRLSIQMGGYIKPLFGGLVWPEVNVKSLTIDSNGQVEVDGGWLDIPKQKALSFHGFSMELTKIGFGNEADGSRWIGFSGGINIVEGIPFKGGVDGLKIIWKEPITDVDNIDNISLKISGIKVGFEIAEVLRFDGAVLFIDDEKKKGFKGGVKMILYPLDSMMLDVQFIAGRNSAAPPFNYFYLFIGTELPMGIPLGATGASLYGMSGLFGYNMLPNKKDEEGWYEGADKKDEAGGENQNSSGWYKRKPVGINDKDKWYDSRDSFAFGAGITLGTADNGYTFSGKVLLVVLIPGPVVLVEGKAQFLKERKGLDEDPIFKLLAVLDAKAGTFLMNIEARYKYPTNGRVIDISGGAEAFFNFNNPNDWHFYLGQETPKTKRIRAQILSIFKANSFFMIDTDRIVMGAWVGLDRKWKFGPLKIVIQAWIDGRLELSFKPVQADGMLALNGNLQLKAFGRGLGISVYAGLTAKAPNPWYVRGEFKVKLNLPWPLPDPKAHIVLEWKEESEPPAPPVLAKIGIEHPVVTEKWDLLKLSAADMINDDDRIVFAEESPIIPPDARPVLTFHRPVEDVTNIGDNPSPPPESEKVGDYRYRYRLKQVSIKKRSKGNSEPWITIDSDLRGSWQVVPGKQSQNIKFMFWSKTPFDISRELESNHSWLYSTLSPWEGYPCKIDIVPELACIDFEDLDVGKEYNPVLLHKAYIFFSEKGPMRIIDIPAPGNATPFRGLTIKGGGKVCVGIPELPDEVKANEIIKGDVVFKCGDGSSLAVKDYFPSNGDGKNDIVVSWSKIDPHASINFPEDSFPTGPQKVIVECGHDGSLEFKAYDAEGKLIDEAAHTAGQGVLDKIQLSGNNIRRIDIIGAEIAISELYYETPAEESYIIVVLPEEMVEADIYLTKGSKGNITVLNKSCFTRGVIPFNISKYIDHVKIQAQHPGESFKALMISGIFIILKICGISKEESLRVDQNKTILTHIKNTVGENWGTHTGALFERDSFYEITVVSETLRKKGNGDWDSYEFTEQAYFQTANPPGAFIPSGNSELGLTQSSSEHYPERGPLRDLSPYISYTIPMQTASNEPQRAAYRSYDIGVKFKESQDYIEQMYLMADLPLTVRIFDNNDQPVMDMEGKPVVLKNNWGKNPETVLTREEKQWRAVLRKTCGIDLSGKTGQKSGSIYAGAKNLVLKPQTLYKSRLCGGEFILYEFSFVTSRYCTFTHQIQSFSDIVWDYSKLAGSPLAPLLSQDSTTFLRDILDQLDASGDHTLTEYEISRALEADAFERIAGPDVFDLGIRQLPERLEIFLLNDSSRSYGLLLESPEPMDWERINCWIKHDNGIENDNGIERVEECSGVIKIIQGTTVSMRDRVDYNQEMVELILKDNMDISGYKIKYKKSSDTAFLNYYTFGEHSLFPAGRVIRIHSGRKSEHQNCSGEVENYYVTAEEESPEWHFDPAGGVLQIVNDSGRVMHSRLTKPDCNNKMDTILIRNKDKTRMFIFFTSGSEKLINIADGRYILGFTFKRFVKDSANLPILKRMGSEEHDEVTQIEFSLPTFLPG